MQSSKSNQEQGFAARESGQWGLIYRQWSCHHVIQCKVNTALHLCVYLSATNTHVYWNRFAKEVQYQQIPRRKRNDQNDFNCFTTIDDFHC